MSVSESSRDSSLSSTRVSSSSIRSRLLFSCSSHMTASVKVNVARSLSTNSPSAPENIILEGNCCSTMEDFEGVTDGLGGTDERDVPILVVVVVASVSVLAGEVVVEVLVEVVVEVLVEVVVVAVAVGFVELFDDVSAFVDVYIDVVDKGLVVVDVGVVDVDVGGDVFFVKLVNRVVVELRVVVVVLVVDVGAFVDVDIIIGLNVLDAIVVSIVDIDVVVDVVDEVVIVDVVIVVVFIVVDLAVKLFCSSKYSMGGARVVVVLRDTGNGFFW